MSRNVQVLVFRDISEVLDMSGNTQILMFRDISQILEMSRNPIKNMLFQGSLTFLLCFSFFNALYVHKSLVAMYFSSYTFLAGAFFLNRKEKNFPLRILDNILNSIKFGRPFQQANQSKLVQFCQ